MPKRADPVGEAEPFDVAVGPHVRRALDSVRQVEQVATRALVVAGRRTTMRLDDETWRVLLWIAGQEQVTVDRLATWVARHRSEELSMTGALRAFTVAYLAGRTIPDGWTAPTPRGSRSAA
ncbi:MAG TPA: ribbon-helix-helix domain-containing protein [Azospirillaceae bacterium]|nr:ribbon-helix-helix domain-containing protein [Azospirillaceae bacterium]